jgi:hypothetical protein
LDCGNQHIGIESCAFQAVRWSEVDTNSAKVAHWGDGGVYQISNLKYKK